MLTLEQKEAIGTAVLILAEYADEYRSNFNKEIEIIDSLLIENGCIEIDVEYGREWVCN